MLKKYIVYCTLVLSSFAYAAENGYVYNSLFGATGAAQKSANHHHK